MTKMNGIHLPDMAVNENLEHIFDENFAVKRKKTDIYLDNTKDVNDPDSFTNNNNLKLKPTDTSEFLKRKIAKNLIEEENFLQERPREVNIRIDKDSNSTIRLELRYPDEALNSNGEPENGEELNMGDKNEEQNGEYNVDGENQENGVRNTHFLKKKVFFLNTGTSLFYEKSNVHLYTE